jgi:hypothetical protein
MTTRYTYSVYTEGPSPAVYTNYRNAERALREFFRPFAVRLTTWKRSSVGCFDWREQTGWWLRGNPGRRRIALTHLPRIERRVINE